MFSECDNKVLDAIISERYTCRSFNDEIPKKSDIEAIIRAGQIAPYASISSKDVDVFRHFFVLFQGDERYETIDRLIRQQSELDLCALKKEEENDIFLKENAGLLEWLWEGVAKNGVSVFPNPPCMIILAEWRGARRAEKQSLAHAMQNMWLKATALNYDFNILSVVESMVDNKEFCNLFGLPVNRYGFHACVIGHCKGKKIKGERVSSEIHW